MQKFISVGKFFFGVCMSLLIVTVGVYFTYMFYMTDQPVHNVFGVIGPAFVVFAFCLAFLVVYELVQELRSEARVRAWVKEAMKTKTIDPSILVWLKDEPQCWEHFDAPVVEDGPINFPTPRSFKKFEEL